jgi:hypothetical protein
MGLTCRCQTLPKGSPGRPCDKCKARNKANDAKRKANGAHRKSQQKFEHTDKGRQAQQKAVQKFRRTDKGRQVHLKADQKFKRKKREAVAAARE